MRKTLLMTVAVVALGVAGAQAESLTEFFAKSDLTALAKSNTVLNLEAQSTAKKVKDDVDTYDDFFLINGEGKLVVNFNHAFKNKGQKRLPGWVGVSKYNNHTITDDIQTGWNVVKAKYALTDGVAHVVVYKTLNAQPPRFVYDFAVPNEPGGTMCQEYLYLPASREVEPGMPTGCYWSLKDFPTAALGSVGKSKK